MDTKTVIAEARRKICGEIDIEQEGVDRFIVYTPFMFDDGDHFVVLLKKQNEMWHLTDEGHTLMHMEYSGVDVTTSGRARVVEHALESHHILNAGGELRMAVPGVAAVGDCLFSFLQGLSRITNVTEMTREVVAESFMDDFRSIIADNVPEDRRTFNWTDPEHDPPGNYPVDCRIADGEKPWFVFGIQSDGKCDRVALVCSRFENLGVDFHSIAMFLHQPSINRRSVARLSDVIGKQFSSIDDKRRIRDYIRTEVLPAASRT